MFSSAEWTITSAPPTARQVAGALLHPAYQPIHHWALYTGQAYEFRVPDPTTIVWEAWRCFFTHGHSGTDPAISIGRGEPFTVDSSVVEA
jgi:hypothetical protein